MNKRPLLGSGQGGLNVRLWVDGAVNLADPACRALVDNGLAPVGGLGHESKGD